MLDGGAIVKLVIIGGVAGGASAAARARRIDEHAEILMVERGPDVSYANCGLPYHIGEMIPRRESLLVSTAAKFVERFRVDVRTRTEAIAIDPAKKTVRLRHWPTGEESTVSYDRLILAPGASPIRPAIPGVDSPRVMTLRTLADTDRIKAVIDNGAKRVAMIGGGFIGLELAENLIHRGVSVTLADRNPQLLGPFDAEMTTPLRKTLEAKGVHIRLGQTLEQITDHPNTAAVVWTNGDKDEFDLIVMGIGVLPENRLAVDAGLTIGPRGGIVVTDTMQTSDPSIWAVGDAVETHEFDSPQRTQIPLAGPANRQGRIAADNALGRNVKFRGVQGTAIVGLFDKVAAMTGLSEKVLKRKGTPYRKVYIHPAHHAGYYPGAEKMTLKLLFDPQSGKILGAQAVGGQGVDKRIDVISVAMQARMTVHDLEDMELCYAPQFGSAKDPINMLGFVAGGLIRQDHPQVDWETIFESPTTHTLVDVRTQAEFEKGHAPNATLIPVDELRNRLSELPKGKPIRVYCQVGQRGYLATRILMQNGYVVANVGGGFETYRLHRP